MKLSDFKQRRAQEGEVETEDAITVIESTLCDPCSTIPLKESSLTSTKMKLMEELLEAQFEIQNYEDAVESTQDELMKVLDLLESGQSDPVGTIQEVAEMLETIVSDLGEAGGSESYEEQQVIDVTVEKPDYSG